jgi:hypothetical protein
MSRITGNLGPATLFSGLRVYQALGPV